MEAKTKLEAALDELLVGKSTEEMIGPDGLLKQFTKALLERAMKAELTHHLGYEKHEPGGRGSGNSRNGQSRKTVQGDFGAVEIAVPRDRNGSFEPKILPKHERRLAGFDDKILSLYARGMTTRDIQSHLEEMYGVEVSPSLISEVTDAVMDEVRVWQSRPLESLYAILYLDALMVKMRHEGRVENRAVCGPGGEPRRSEGSARSVDERYRRRRALATDSDRDSQPGCPRRSDCLRGWTERFSRSHSGGISQSTSPALHCASGS